MKVLIVLCLVAGLSYAAPPPRSLTGDFLDFLLLLPVDDLKEIACSYKDDEEVVYVLNYLRSDEWAALMAEVGSNEIWISFKEYLNDAGVNVDLIVAFIHALIQNGFCDDARAVIGNRSFKDFLDAELDALPKEELKALWYDKLENSPEFKEFYDKISSDKARELVDDVLALEEVQKIIAKLVEFGVDVQKIKDFIWNLLGWE